MTFPCPCRACGHANHVEWSRIGREIACGGCGKTMTVPAPMETVGEAAEPVTTLRFACPSCGRKFATKPEMAGKKIVCNRCGAGVRVPQGDSTVAAHPSRSAMKAHESNDPATAPSRPDRGRPKAIVEASDSSSLLDELASIERAERPERAESVLPTRAEVMEQVRQTAAVRETAETPKKKSKKTKKKKKKAEGGDSLDKRVLAAVVAIGLAFVGFVGFFVYDAFLKPLPIAGTWAGSMMEFEIGHPIIVTKYRLILDEQKRASLTLHEKFTSVGTYAVEGNRLKLTLKDETFGKDDEGGGGMAADRQYKFSLGRETLDLFDPQTGKKTVQLLRFREKPVVGGGSPPASTPKDLAAGAAGPVDKDEDARLASVEFSPKDGAFRLRHPEGWKSETGSRPDNLYSWARFTKGSAKIQVFADTAGSLMSGSATAQQHEEGSVLAPVHNAHELYKKNAAEMYSDYKETEPTVFKGSQLGEGRIAAFAASSGGLLGSRLKGYRVTLLTNDRRISILCEGPPGDFNKLKLTFLAVCRSLAR